MPGKTLFYVAEQRSSKLHIVNYILKLKHKSNETMILLNRKQYIGIEIENYFLSNWVSARASGTQFVTLWIMGQPLYPSPLIYNVFCRDRVWIRDMRLNHTSQVVPFPLVQSPRGEIDIIDSIPFHLWISYTDKRMEVLSEKDKKVICDLAVWKSK